MDRATIHIAYGRGQLPVRLPKDAEPNVIRKAVLPKLKDPAGAIQRAFENPIGSAPFAELARGRGSACILICDITRPVPNRLFLRPMIETTSWRPGFQWTGSPCWLRPACTDRTRARNWPSSSATPGCSPTCASPTTSPGTPGITPISARTATRGTPIPINRRFIDADLRIATGLVEPHFMAGWSGGRKVVAPGVAGHETIRTFHSARFMEDPLAVQCNLDGNPLHEEQLEIVRRIGEIYALNTVINEDRDLVHVTFGEIIASHLAAVDFIAKATQIKVRRRFKTIVTSSAGYPLDKTYYQTVKGMVTPLDILEPGGTLIIASECSEGFGSPEFRAAQERLVDLGPERFLATLQAKTFADIDEWQTEMQLKSTRLGRVALYTTGLTPEERRITGVDIVTDLDEAVADSIRRSGDHALAVIPEGPYVVPIHAASGR